MSNPLKTLVKLPLLILGLVSVSHAAEVRYRSCLLKLVDNVNVWETGDKAPINIVEFKFPESGSKYFGDRELSLASVPILKEVFGIYRRPMIARAMQRQFQTSRIVEAVPESQLPSLLEPGKVYTYVIHDDKIVFAQTRPGVVRDIASKHALLQDQGSPLRMAGEMWVDSKGKFHVDGGSGTFQPNDDDLARGLSFFRDHLGIKDIEAHKFVPAPPTASDEAKRLFSRFNMPVSVARSGRTAYAFSNLGEGSTIEEMDGSEIEADGKKYRVMKTNSVKSSESIYDTANLGLTKKGSEFRTSESKLDQSSPALAVALKKLPAGSKLTVQAKEDIFTTEYGLFPVSNGVVNLTRPAGYFNMEKSVRTGVGRSLSGKTDESFQAEFEGDPILRSILEQRLGLKPGAHAQSVPVIKQLRSEAKVE